MEKDIPVYTMNYILSDDIVEAMGCKWNDFIFIDKYEDGPCAFLDLNDKKVEKLEEKIKYCQNKSEENFYYQYCKNELKLVNYLRSKGFKETMCILY